MATKEDDAKVWLLSNLKVIQSLPAAIGDLFEEDEHNADKQASQGGKRDIRAKSDVLGLEKYKEENKLLKERANDLEQQLERERSFREKRDVKFKELYNEKIGEVEAYKSRLAAVSENRVQLDQRKVENTLSRNRQSEVEKYYQEFYDGKRVDAVEKLEQKLSSNFRSFTPVDQQLRRQRLVCKIFEIAYETAMQVKETFIQHSVTLVDSLPQQAIKMGLDGVTNKYSSNKKPIPFEIPTRKRVLESSRRVLVDSLMLSLKEDTQPPDMKELFRAVTSSVKARYKEDDNRFLHSFDGAFTSTVKKYIQDSATLSWVIITQVPPLVLEYKHATYDPKLHVANQDRIQKSTGHVVSRSSSQIFDVGIRNNNETTNYVYCYLWPALLDADRRVIIKGEVLLHA